MLPSVFFLTQAVTIPTPAASSGCAAALKAAPGAKACAASSHGVALAETQADRLIADGVTGERRVLQVFGRAPSRYAIHAFDQPSDIPVTVPALRQIGMTAVLPTPSVGSLARQRERASASS